MYHHLSLQEIGINQTMSTSSAFGGGQERTGITKILLSNFRNYQNLEIKTELLPIVLCGANGAGKTNLLEAISFLTPGRGLRRSKLSEITCETAKVKNWSVYTNIKIGDKDFQVGTGLDFNPESKKEKRIVKIDGKISKNQADLNQIITTVWLTPEMDRLFRGSPSARRRFLDRLVYAYDPEHSSRLQAYENALRQWLLIISSNKVDAIWLSSLEETLAAKSVSIAAARKETVFRLNHIAKENNKEFPIADIMLEGMVENMLDDFPATEVEDKVKQFLVQSRKKALETHSLNGGVHRTDIKAFYVQKKVEASCCSTGEQKAILISIILAQARSMVSVLGKKPILLLDEIMAHLDEARRKALFDEICHLKLQAWLTGTDKEIFCDLNHKAQFLQVDNAHINYLQ